MSYIIKFTTMIKLNKFSLAFCAAGLGLLSLTGCEGGELYNVNSPDWVSGRIDEIKAEKEKGGGEEEEIEGLKEDVYQIGAADFSTGWWQQFSKDYPIADGETWIAQFTLNINPQATNTYKNFALIVTNDAHRGDAEYKEYGACRFDHQPSGNSEWGDLYFEAHRGDVKSTLTFNTDTDPGVDQLGGKVTLTVDRSKPNAFLIKITNGTVTKTMDIKEALPNFNEDPSNTNIRAFLVPEGSYINFIGTTLVPIGGLTSKEDKQPLKMTLHNVPDQALQSVSIKEAFAGVTATIEFEQGVTANVTADDLIFQAIPDDGELGMKTLIVMYNKTFKGEYAEETIAATAEYELVDKLSEPTTIMAFPQPVILGNEDNSTPWWTFHTENIKVERRQTVVVNFTNYSNCINNWHNFCIVLNGEDTAKEYGVVRADNFGWGSMWDNNPSLVKTTDWADWDAWRAAMDGAKVTAYITNNSNGTANIKAEMLGNDGVLYTVEYQNLCNIDKDDMYFRFVCEGSHLVFDTKEAYTKTVHPTPKAVGAEDFSSPWWTEFTENIKIEPFQTVKSSFTNYTNGLNNWNNFLVVLNGQELNEYAVVRADNWGWGAGFDGNTKLTRSHDWGDGWATWLAAMNGAKVNVSITNKGNGMADIDIEMEGTDGILYELFYHDIIVNAKDLYFRYTVDGCHLIMD